MRAHRSSVLPRSPSASSASVTAAMKANTASNTSPEILLRQSLREQGITGYRLNWKKAPGRPDVAFPGKKVAIFVNGCFWHHCPVCNLPLPKSNTEFWTQKFELNKERDREKVQTLEAAGWTVLVFWEHEIKSDTKQLVNQVKHALRQTVKKVN